MDIKKLKNWKEHPKFLELKSHLENEKVGKVSAGCLKSL